MQQQNEAMQQAMKSAVSLIDQGHKKLARQLLIDAIEGSEVNEVMRVIDAEPGDHAKVEHTVRRMLRAGYARGNDHV